MSQLRPMPQIRRPAVMSWVPVTGADGRVRMEVCWHVGAISRTTAKVRGAAA